MWRTFSGTSNDRGRPEEQEGVHTLAMLFSAKAPSLPLGASGVAEVCSSPLSPQKYQPKLVVPTLLIGNDLCCPQPACHCQGEHSLARDMGSAGHCLSPCPGPVQFRRKDGIHHPNLPNFCRRKCNFMLCRTFL